MRKQIRVFAPATVANVVCGFDVLGFALEAPGDEVILKITNKPGITITNITVDGSKLPLNPAKNAVSISILSFLEYLDSNQGLEIELFKKMPLNSGLGSSAASAVAGVFAVNEILGRPLSKKDLLPFALNSEKEICGDIHADNIAPSLMGGFVLIRSYEPIEIIKLPAPPQLFCTVIHPHISISTRDARQILKKEIPLKEVTSQMANIGGMITGLLTNDFNLISRSMQDVIAEPYRSKLIPGYKDIKNAALNAGALGCGISGSGPSMFALSTEKKIAEAIGFEMQEVFVALHLDSDIYVSKINKKGARVLDN
jgi:homoserine kinase